MRVLSFALSIESTANNYNYAVLIAIVNELYMLLPFKSTVKAGEGQPCKAP